MKRFLLTAVLSAAVASAVQATSDSYINIGTVTTPISIDATNFVNLGVFGFSTTSLYDFTGVRNFTNRNVMRNGSLDQAGTGGGGGSTFLTNGVFPVGGTGFRFDTVAPGTGTRTMAQNFYNAPIAGNAATNARVYADYQLLISATNLVNAGLLGVSEYGLMSLTGKSVDLTRGVLQVGGFGDRSTLRPEAVFDQHWAFGNVVSTPATEIIAGDPQTPAYDVVTFTGVGANPYGQARQSLFPFVAGLDATQITSAMWSSFAGTNGVVQIVFVRNHNTNVPVQFQNPNPTPTRPGISQIVWSSVGTNALGRVATNFVMLTDRFGFEPTNTFLIVNYPYASPPPNSVPIEPSSRQPTNFVITRPVSVFGFGTNHSPFVTPIDPVEFWGPGRVTNSYSAYKAKLATTTMDSLEITNTRIGPGRIEMAVDRSLDMALARVEGLNYMKIQATNHFKGASNASVSVTYADIALASTNGNLSTSGLLNSTIPRINGTLDCYSAVWTNSVPTPLGLTNSVIFNVLFVDADLEGFTAPELFNLSLRATNVELASSCIVHDNLSLAAERLTLSSNAVLDIRRQDILWPTVAPGIKSFTNWGSLTSPGNLEFVGRNANNSPRPYVDFLNQRTITGAGISIDSANVLNAGSIRAVAGSLGIHSSSAVVLQPNGGLESAFEAVTISCRDLTVTNHTITVGRELTLSVTNNLNAGTNNWTVRNGFNLLRKPATGDLLGTTVTDMGFSYSLVPHVWPGADKGAVVSGFTNNAALGMLVLDGQNNTLFDFAGTGISNALYVDRLELTNSASSFDAQGNLTQISLQPGMKIYYAQATMNGASIAEFLNGKNGGRLQWISGYAGAFSGVNVVYPDGSTNFLNAALVSSCNLDSDSDGVPNCIDPTPVFIPQAFTTIAARIVTTPSPAMALSWRTTAGALNKVFSATNPNLPPAQWLLVTNVVSPSQLASPFTQEAKVPLGSGARFYRVEILLPQ